MRRLAPRLLLLAILLLAGALRFHRLAAQSLWNDEGNSARIAERPLALILEGAAGDIHPPGYYLLLHGWRALAGHSEFSLRALSAFAGVLTTLLTYLLGRRLFGLRVGIGAALLNAVSSFAIYYAQEARMYTLLAAVAAASMLLMLRLLGIGRAPGRRRLSADKRSDWVCAGAYVLVSAAGLYTQYTFSLILVVQNAVYVLWWLCIVRRGQDRWRWLALWIEMQVAVAILYLPWLSTALASVTGWPVAGRGYALGRGLLDVLRVLSAGITLPAEQATPFLALTGMIALLGLWPGRTSRGVKGSVITTALWLLLPIALLFAFDLYKPAWLKFLLIVLLPFHILVARGLETLALHVAARTRRPERHLWPVYLVCAGLVAVSAVPSLSNLYDDPRYARDDYRGIAADIAAAHRAGDAVVLHAPNQWEVFTYYYPDQDVYPAPYQPTPEDARAFVEDLSSRYRRLFVLFWGDDEADPQGLIEHALAERAYHAGERWVGSVRLVRYGLAAQPAAPSVALVAQFGDAIRLRGYAVAASDVAPGDIAPITLFWEAEQVPQEPYKVTVQVLDATGQLVAQHDGEPGAGLAPTLTWQPGQLIVDRHGIELPAGLPEGQYTLIVGLYHAATGSRLPVPLGGGQVGDHLVLTTLDIGR